MCVYGAPRQAEAVRNGAVQLTDDLIDGFLPAGVSVTSTMDGIEELPQSQLGHLHEPLRDLCMCVGEGDDNMSLNQWFPNVSIDNLTVLTV